MGSTFGNVYAEGYPRWASRTQTEAEILDFEAELAHYRRYSDPRYYKGVEYADMLEALARRRAAELFAANDIGPDQLFVNVQPLSGSPANSQVFAALLEPGETLMGLDLVDGGHLTHGSPVNRSGRIYNAVSYHLDSETESLDYDAIARLAHEHRPRLIIAGFTAYPLTVDWQRFRAIADSCGAYLLADIAHISGLVATGVHPSPVGIADVVTTTTHKSLCGPRGAMIMTHDAQLARRIDRAVFPGEQGGPHLNTIAALAYALELAQSDKFRELQRRIAENARRLAAKLQDHGLRVVSGRSENHLILIDTKSVTRDGVHLSGDMAARILDVAGFVTNRNTIPGDRSAFAATGIRLGTVWISQLGFGNAEVDMLAEGLATVLKGCQPYIYLGPGNRRRLRAKVTPAALKAGRQSVSELTDMTAGSSGGQSVEVRGAASTPFLSAALASDVLTLENGQAQASELIIPDDERLALILERTGSDCYHLHFTDRSVANRAAEWLSDLSDGYIRFDDLHAKLPGPIVAQVVDRPSLVADPDNDPLVHSKPYFVGHQSVPEPETTLPAFEWQEPTDAALRKTHLHETHVELGARMVPFGGWDMPVWYSSVGDEHAAVRETAGLFDVSHMGVFEASGPFAASFLDTVTTNDIHGLSVGRSHYTYLLYPDGSVVDDLLVYRRAPDRFMLVVNAANNDKDWAWLNAVNEARVRISRERPWAQIQHSATLRDLRDPQWGDDCRVDLALQGPHARAILVNLSDDPETADRISKLPWSGLTDGNLAGLDVIVSRTGYTGERIAYELFVHPEHSRSLWNALLREGQNFGLKPCGLAARDSTRTEAGLPLYGHELAGPLDLSPAEAGFANYVKTWKPFFIGRNAYIKGLESLNREVVRFRMNEKAVRRAELGDPVLDRRGRVVGTVSSCAIDSSGYLLGQAILPAEMAQPDTEIAIYQLGGGERQLRVPSELRTGARLPIPDRATVLSRFP